MIALERELEVKSVMTVVLVNEPPGMVEYRSEARGGGVCVCVCMTVSVFVHVTNSLTLSLVR